MTLQYKEQAIKGLTLNHLIYHYKRIGKTKDCKDILMDMMFDISTYNQISLIQATPVKK